MSEGISEIEQSMLAEDELAEKLGRLAGMPQQEVEVPEPPLAPVEEDEEVEPPDEQEGDEPELPPEEDEWTQLVAKHGSEEMAARALLDEKRNLNEVLGRQGQELGELRPLRDRIVQEHLQPQQPQQPQQQPLPMLDEQTVNAFDELTQTRPDQAASWALQNQQPLLYQRAMETWFEVNPQQASAFQTELAVQRARYELQQELQPTLQTVQQQQLSSENSSMLGQAWQNLEARYPQLRETATAEAIVQELQANPEDQQGLLQGGLVERQRVLENLYWRVQSRNQQQAEQQIGDQQARQTAQAETMKRQAQTASAATSPVRMQPGRARADVDAIRQAIRDTQELDIHAAMQNGGQ